MEKIALFDLDGTLTDYFKSLRRDLNAIKSPHEPELGDIFRNELHIEARRHMITSQVGWWLKLEKFQLGWDILEEVKKLNYKIVVLTKGPTNKYSAWSEKVEWCNKHLSEYIEGVTITHNKGLVYGKLLVDDYPPYVEDWLKWRPRGLVIMPAHEYNKDFRHPNVVRYDGTNMDEVIERLLAKEKEWQTARDSNS